MNFLALVNDAMFECGTGLTVPLSTVVGSTNAEVNRFIGWTKDSWIEIQTDHPTWNYLRSTVQIIGLVSAGTPNYSLAAVSANVLSQLVVQVSIADYIPKTFRAFHTSQGAVDEQIVNYMDWSTFRNIYRYATMRTTQSRPMVCAVDPQKQLWFGPVPDDNYTVECEVYSVPQTLAVDSDIPVGPLRWHKAITYKTMMKYAAFESAPEVASRGQDEYDRLMKQLDADQLPKMGFGPPLE